MRDLGFFILFFGLLGWNRAALNDGDDQNNSLSANELCQQIFNRPCNLSDNGCICVPYYQCTKDGDGITDGSGTVLINRRMEECGDHSYRCCRKKEINDTVTRDPKTSQPFINPGCGHRNSNGITIRLTDTNMEAQFGEFPWMVAVLYRPLTGTENTFECGGALIHPRAVLTTAHNVENYANSSSDLVVRAGEWDTASTSESLPYQERRVKTILYHEKFNTENLHKDFAILILETAFDIAGHVNTICLPQKGEVFDGARCFATGWGKNKFGKNGEFQSILKKIELPVLTRDSCQTQLRTTRLGIFFELDQSLICAGGEPDQDSCTGDGGGPLVCPLQNHPDRYVQAGIVSWGIGCGEDLVPGVYANVAFARRWIDRKLAMYGLDTSWYTA